MEKSVIEKKFKKLGTKDLRARVDRGKLTPSEKEIAEAILKSRETPTSYKSPDFEKESKSTMEKISKSQEDVSDSAAVPVKSSKKETSSKRVKLSEEDQKKIKEIVDNFKGSKKELVVHLFESGFTKQQLDKYRPEIAHWSYIYTLAKELGK